MGPPPQITPRKISTEKSPSFCARKPKLLGQLHQRSNSQTKLIFSRNKAYNTFKGKKVNRDEMACRGLALWASRTFSTETLLFFSFWLFGTLVTMQFGVVVTAANDLVGNKAPPGLILFAYTLPSIMVRMLVPYIKFPDVEKVFASWTSPRASDYSSINTPRTPGTPGFPLRSTDKKPGKEVNYAVRLSICAGSSFLGLQLLAWADNVGIRMLGIALASLSSNLGDMSFFQLATRYPSMIAKSFGGYAAGSGAAGLIGAAVYTFLTTTFAVSPSAVISGIGFVPSLMLITYFMLLPSSEAVEEAADGSDSPDSDSETSDGDGGAIIGSLRFADKIKLVKPMVWGYMAPLAILMFLENVTTQGILPTILWNLPFSQRFATARYLNMLFKTTRDFYPFFFTVYQFAVFMGRTSITLFRLPGGSRRSSTAFWVLCATEVGCFIAQMSQSASMMYTKVSAHASDDPDAGVAFSPVTVGLFILIMGLCGGLGMSNVYWRVSKKPLPPSVWTALDEARMKHLRGQADDDDDSGSFTPSRAEFGDGDGYFAPQHNKKAYRPRHRRTSTAGGTVYMLQDCALPPGFATGSGSAPLKRSQQEETAVREFLISTIALPDTIAILVASMISLLLQPELCRRQMEGGRDLCAVGGS